MSKKNRKTLQALTPASDVTLPIQQSAIIQKFKLEPKEATKRFTIDLPERMHRKLSILSARSGRTKADIMRMMLDEILMDVAE
jgi:macrodomain Ter protein organizer (MatP/YcbG family)